MGDTGRLAQRVSSRRPCRDRRRGPPRPGGVAHRWLGPCRRLGPLPRKPSTVRHRGAGRFTARSSPPERRRQRRVEKGHVCRASGGMVLYNRRCRRGERHPLLPRSTGRRRSVQAFMGGTPGYGPFTRAPRGRGRESCRFLPWQAGDFIKGITNPGAVSPARRHPEDVAGGPGSTTRPSPGPDSSRTSPLGGLLKASSHVDTGQLSQRS